MKPCVRTWKAKTTKEPNPLLQAPPTEIAKTSKRRKIQFVKFRSVTGNEKTQNTETRKITEKFRGVSRRFEAFRGVSRAEQFCRKNLLKTADFDMFRWFWHLFRTTHPRKLPAFWLVCSGFAPFQSRFSRGNENGISRRFEAFRGISRAPRNHQNLKNLKFRRVLFLFSQK